MLPANALPGSPVSLSRSPSPAGQIFFVYHETKIKCSQREAEFARGLASLQGPVYALAAANNMLFSSGHDCSIRVYQFDQAAGLFQEAVSAFLQDM